MLNDFSNDFYHFIDSNIYNTIAGKSDYILSDYNVTNLHLVSELLCILRI